MTLRLDLSRGEKRTLLEMVDNEKYSRQAKYSPVFLSVDKKREIGEFVNEMKAIYATVKVALNDSGPLLFPGKLAYSIQAIVVAAMSYTKQGAGAINKNNLLTFEKIVEQTVTRPVVY